jgi:hypothetical protein
MPIPFVIPSKARAEILATHTLKLIPDAIVCVDEAEVPVYREVTDNILPHPPLPGLAAIREWIYDYFAPGPEDVIVQMDDDLGKCYSLIGKNKQRVRSPEAVRAIIENCATCALGVGAKLFGFNNSQDVKAFRAQDPFRLAAFPDGAVLGTIGRTVRHNTSMTLRAHVDFTLQHLLVNRIVWVDHRFCFESQRFSVPGGNAVYRSSDREQAELAYLKRKWGQYVHFGHRAQSATAKGKGRGAATTVIRVDRRWKF